MNQQTAIQFQNSLGISKDLIIREEYEMLLLKAFYDSSIASELIFKGGTALCLAYGSVRFSEDLDFDLLSTVSKADIQSAAMKVSSQNPEITLSDIQDKRNTLFALFKVSVDFLALPFTIKFEASKRNYAITKKDYSLQLLTSSVTNSTVLAQVETLERIKKDKLDIAPQRVRDVYDIWFINQKLGENTPLIFSDFDIKTVKREMNKFIPERERRLFDLWLQAN